MVLTKEEQKIGRMSKAEKIINNNFYAEKEVLKYYIITDEDSKANDFLIQFKPHTTTLWDDLWAVDNNIFRRLIRFYFILFF